MDDVCGYALKAEEHFACQLPANKFQLSSVITDDKKVRSWKLLCFVLQNAATVLSEWFPY